MRARLEEAAFVFGELWDGAPCPGVHCPGPREPGCGWPVAEMRSERWDYAEEAGLRRGEVSVQALDRALEAWGWLVGVPADARDAVMRSVSGEGSRAIGRALGVSHVTAQRLVREGLAAATAAANRAAGKKSVSTLGVLGVRHG